MTLVHLFMIMSAIGAVILVYNIIAYRRDKAEAAK